jgi:hypothetical protein
MIPRGLNSPDETLSDSSEETRCSSGLCTFERFCLSVKEDVSRNKNE